MKQSYMKMYPRIGIKYYKKKDSGEFLCYHFLKILQKTIGTYSVPSSPIDEISI